MLWKALKCAATTVFNVLKVLDVSPAVQLNAMRTNLYLVALRFEIWSNPLQAWKNKKQSRWG